MILLNRKCKGVQVLCIILVIIQSICVIGMIKNQISSVSKEEQVSSVNKEDQVLSVSKEDIKIECIEDDTIAECTITNTSKVDAKRVYINYYVYDDKGKCLYQVGEVVSIKAGQSKYTDLDMINGYDHTEIEITDVN